MHKEATNVFRDSLKLRQKLLQRTTTYFKVVEFVKKDAIRYFTYDYEIINLENNIMNIFIGNDYHSKNLVKLKTTI